MCQERKAIGSVDELRFVMWLDVTTRREFRSRACSAGLQILLESPFLGRYSHEFCESGREIP